MEIENYGRRNLPVSRWMETSETQSFSHTQLTRAAYTAQVAQRYFKGNPIPCSIFYRKSLDPQPPRHPITGRNLISVAGRAWQPSTGANAVDAKEVLAEILMGKWSSPLSQQTTNVEPFSKPRLNHRPALRSRPFRPAIPLNVIAHLDSSPASQCRRRAPSSLRVIARSSASSRGLLLYPLVNSIAQTRR
jgi:hypothetical protein